ncbi:MAG: hypothetical protein ACOVS5_18245, partial [Oligoflexus sp.]
VKKPIEMTPMNIPKLAFLLSMHFTSYSKTDKLAPLPTSQWTSGQKLQGQGMVTKCEFPKY